MKTCDLCIHLDDPCNIWEAFRPYKDGEAQKALEDHFKVKLNCTFTIWGCENWKEGRIEKQNEEARKYRAGKTSNNLKEEKPILIKRKQTNISTGTGVGLGLLLRR